ncbi:MAG TPA: EamA family transporter [Gaiellaceae bacterium]|nr:EamA family transporter [Gaiellaceae bacterium]
MSAVARTDALVAAPPAVDRVALGAFAGVVVIGGTNFVGVRFSNRGLDPLWGAGLRFALAAAIFGLLVAALRLPLPRGRALVLSGAYGLLSFAGAYGCIYWAMQEVPAGVAAVVLALGPLLTLLLAVAHGMERLSGRALAGALVALAGSVVIFFQPDSFAFGWESLALLGVGALFAAQAVVVSKLVGPHHPAAINFVGMSAGAVVLVGAAAVVGERLALPAGGGTQLALVYLVAATVALFLLALVVVQRWAASAASYAFVLMPVIAVALGAVLAGEPITPTTVTGGAIVCAGVVVGAARRG